MRRCATIAALQALFLSGCASTVDPAFSENALHQMLGTAANVPMPSDLPKVGNSDWCTRVNLVLDNPKLSPSIKNQYLEVGRTKGCERALAAQH
jgi:uncharacterized protein YceK